MYKIAMIFARKYEEIFPYYNGRRALQPHQLELALEQVRSTFWDHPLTHVDYDHASFVVEKPPLGSKFDSSGGYLTPGGLYINRTMRNGVRVIKARYRQMQEIQLKQTRENMRLFKLGQVIESDSDENESENDDAPKAEAANGSSTY